VAFAPGVDLPAGPVSVEMYFVGGATPTVRELRCLAPPLVLTIEDHKLRLGGQEVATTAPLAAVEGLLDHLHDLAVRVEAVAGNELWVKLAPGLAATIPPRATVTVDAATRGPPNRPRLRRPLVVSVGGAGLSIRLPGSRWLKALASVAIRGASLAPDGEVELTGHSSGALDRVVGAGLRKTSSHLSELVRRSPQFAQVRSFLGPGLGPEEE
jgi:hypothetical protein